MTTDFRALCAELLDEVIARPLILDRELITRARAALAKPADAPAAVAERPSDEELRDLWSWAAGQDQGPWPTQYHCFARAVLSRWAHPAATPVPVSERLPAAGEWVWHCYAEVRFWEHGRYNGRQFFIGDGPESQPATHWLPANALPLPAPEGGEVS